MEAVISSPYMKLVSSSHKNVGFLSLKDYLLAKSILTSPIHHSRNNYKTKNVDFNVSISVSSTRRGVCPVSLSSCQTQAEVENYGLQIEESSNGHMMEVEGEEDTEAVTHGHTVHVRFQLQKECSFGQNFLIVGDDPMFGLWDPNNAIPLTWSDGHVWTVDLDILKRKCIRFKFIMQESNGKFMWQPGPDRILECWKTEKNITICEDWENPDSQRIIEADPTFNQAEELAATTEIQMVAANIGMPVEPSVDSTGVPKFKKSSTKAQTAEPKGYAINMKKSLASDEGVPVLIPGSSQLPKTDPEQEGLVHKVPKDEPEPVNGAAMVSSGADIAKDLKLPEVDA